MARGGRKRAATMSRRLNSGSATIALILAASIAVYAQQPMGTAQLASPPRPGPGQYLLHDQYDESPWSDRFTGGHVEHAELVANDPNIEITVDVPAFRLTLW